MIASSALCVVIFIGSGVKLPMILFDLVLIARSLFTAAARIGSVFRSHLVVLINYAF